MKFKLILFFLVITFGANCQTFEFTRYSEIDDVANKLISKGIDTLCVYRRWNEKVDPNQYFYILWKENGKTKFQKITFRKTYNILEVEASDFWEKLILNFNTIKTENYKDFEFIQKIDGKDQITPYITERTNIFEFSAYIKGDFINFSLDQFEIDEFDIYEGKKNININFEYNNSLKGKAVIDELKKIAFKVYKD